MVLSQALTDQNIKGYGKIDSINRPEEVEAFVRSIENRYSSFMVNTVLTFDDDNCFRLGDLNKLTAITKADFDKNGFTDLLVIGMLGKHPVVLCLMGSINNEIDMHVISKHFRRTCSIARIVYENGTPLIEYKYFKANYAIVYKDEPVNSDKLIFKFGGFVDYNLSPKKYNIEKIEYTMGAGGDPLSSFSMEINSKHKGRYISQNVDFLSRKNTEYINFNGMIPDTIHDEIFGLLNYADFPNLNDNYAITATDHATALLKITYDGGKIKTIRDYGLLGTQSLNRLYQIMDSLRSQVWTPEPIKAIIPLPGATN